MKQESIKLFGNVIEDLSNSHFRVELDNGMTVNATICGKIRQKNIRIFVGDSVEMEASPYDLTNARITYRLTGKEFKKNNDNDSDNKNKKKKDNKKKH